MTSRKQLRKAIELHTKNFKKAMDRGHTKLATQEREAAEKLQEMLKRL